MLFPWGDNRRFNSYSNYFTKQFGGRVQKISIDAGFSCPNRDGKISTGGCTFCSNDAFNPSYCRPEKSIKQQIEEGIEFHQRRYRRANKYLAYFQPFSNTYKPLEELKRIYSQAFEAIDSISPHPNTRNDMTSKAMEMPQIIGIVIGTRPDLVDEALLQYLNEIQQTHYVMLEYGVESVYDETLRRVNRGHDFATAEKAIRMTADYGIPCGAHFIFGLPGESKTMMLDAADIISRLPLTTVKFHQLQIFKGTKMAEEYLDHPEHFHLFDLEEYIDFVIDFAERLNPDIVIERFAGEVPPRYLVSEPWMKLRYDEVLAKIEKRMEERNTWQGKKFIQFFHAAP
ncbi:MAG: TIGR01212 family radical SAM protein [Bacteroidales bacterium]|nr:TIGR01212 family radical SAM protein [Bacteroidales bacterium]